MATQDPKSQNYGSYLTQQGPHGYGFTDAQVQQMKQAGITNADLYNMGLGQAPQWQTVYQPNTMGGAAGPGTQQNVGTANQQLQQAALLKASLAASNQQQQQPQQQQQQPQLTPAQPTPTVQTTPLTPVVNPAQAPSAIAGPPPAIAPTQGVSNWMTPQMQQAINQMPMPQLGQQMPQPYQQPVQQFQSGSQTPVTPPGVQQAPSAGYTLYGGQFSDPYAQTGWYNPLNYGSALGAYALGQSMVVNPSPSGSPSSVSGVANVGSPNVFEKPQGFQPNLGVAQGQPGVFTAAPMPTLGAAAGWNFSTNIPGTFQQGNTTYIPKIGGGTVAMQNGMYGNVLPNGTFQPMSPQAAQAAIYGPNAPGMMSPGGGSLATPFMPLTAATPANAAQMPPSGPITAYPGSQGYAPPSAAPAPGPAPGPVTQQWQQWQQPMPMGGPSVAGAFRGVTGGQPPIPHPTAFGFNSIPGGPSGGAANYTSPSWSHNAPAGGGGTPVQHRADGGMIQPVQYLQPGGVAGPYGYWGGYETQGPGVPPYWAGYQASGGAPTGQPRPMAAVGRGGGGQQGGGGARLQPQQASNPYFSPGRGWVGQSGYMYPTQAAAAAGGPGAVNQGQWGSQAGQWTWPWSGGWHWPWSERPDMRAPQTVGQMAPAAPGASDWGSRFGGGVPGVTTIDPATNAYSAAANSGAISIRAGAPNIGSLAGEQAFVTGEPVSGIPGGAAGGQSGLSKGLGSLGSGMQQAGQQIAASAKPWQWQQNAIGKFGSPVGQGGMFQGQNFASMTT